MSGHFIIPGTKFVCSKSNSKAVTPFPCVKNLEDKTLKQVSST